MKDKSVEILMGGRGGKFVNAASGATSFDFLGITVTDGGTIDSITMSADCEDASSVVPGYYDTGSFIPGGGTDITVSDGKFFLHRDFR